MSEKWLEFRVTDLCPHEQDIYEGCPLCQIKKLETKIKEAIRMLSLDTPYVQTALAILEGEKL